MGSFDKHPLSVRLVVTLSFLVAAELALAAVESMIPPFLPLPGVKLGLPNIVTLIALSLFERRHVFLVVLLRLILAGLVLGTFLSPAFWISCAGGLLSFFVMALCAGRRRISIVGVSLAGASAHNTGQLFAVMLLIRSTGIFSYLPWFMLSSIPMGLFTGAAGRAGIAALRNSGISVGRSIAAKRLR